MGEAAKRSTVVGLIGCGRWGRNILRDLVASGAEVHVAERNEENRKKAMDMGATSVVPDLLAFPATVDGYVVAVQTEYHFEVLKTLATTGKPVFVEKPITANLGQAKTLQEMMGDRVFVMHKWRYHPGVQAIADIVKDGRFGDPVRLVCRRLQWQQPHTDVDAFWILMPHDLSITYHILGELPDVTALQADVSENHIHSMTVLMGAQPSVQLEISDLYPTTLRGIILHLEKAVVSLNDPLADHIEIRYLDETGRPTDQVEKQSISTEYPLLREIKGFVSYLSGGEKPMSPIEDEIKIMETLQSMRDRAFAGR